jgi:hypothetical protein
MTMIPFNYEELPLPTTTNPRHMYIARSQPSMAAHGSGYDESSGYSSDRPHFPFEGDNTFQSTPYDEDIFNGKYCLY